MNGCLETQTYSVTYPQTFTRKSTCLIYALNWIKFVCIHWIIIIIIYFENIHFFCDKLGLDVCPYEVPPHTSLNTAHSECKPNTFMSSSTHSFQVFLFLPLHLTPATSIFLQADTQSSTLLRSRCPNHLNLLRLTTSSTLCTPKRLYKSTLRFLSISYTPHIHFTIIRSILSGLGRFSFFRHPGFSPICQHTLDTYPVYLSLYVVWLAKFLSSYGPSV